MSAPAMPVPVLSATAPEIVPVCATAGRQNSEARTAAANPAAQAILMIRAIVRPFACQGGRPIRLWAAGLGRRIARGSGVSLSRGPVAGREDSSPRRRCLWRAARRNVGVHPEEIRRVEAILDRGQPLEPLAIGGPDVVGV